MEKLFGLILAFLLGLVIGNFSEQNFMFGLGLFFVGFILTFIVFYFFKQQDILFKKSGRQSFSFLFWRLQVLFSGLWV